MDTNMAAVADKVVTEITQLVQQTSPEVWKILLRQVVIEGYESLVTAVLAGGVGVVGACGMAWGIRKIRECDANPKYIDTNKDYASTTAFGVLSITSWIVLYCNAVSAFEHLTNPAFQAARLLLNHLQD